MASETQREPATKGKWGVGLSITTPACSDPEPSYTAGSTLNASGTYTTGWTISSVTVIYADDMGTTRTINPSSGISQTGGNWSASFSLPTTNDWEYLICARAYNSSTGSKDHVDHWFCTGTAPTTP
jgi:hypothetical protein